MAKAEKSFIEVEKIVKIKEEFIILQLSLEEAEFIRSVVGYVVGEGKLKRISSAIFSELSLIIPTAKNPFKGLGGFPELVYIKDEEK